MLALAGQIAAVVLVLSKLLSVDLGAKIVQLWCPRVRTSLAGRAKQMLGAEEAMRWLATGWKLAAARHASPGHAQMLASCVPQSAHSAGDCDQFCSSDEAAGSEYAHACPAADLSASLSVHSAAAYDSASAAYFCTFHPVYNQGLSLRQAWAGEGGT